MPWSITVSKWSSIAVAHAQAAALKADSSWTFKAPAGSSPRRPRATFGLKTAGTLNDLKVLVVEDQSLIAMDIEETLTRLGVAEIRLAPDVDEAALILNSFKPDVAVLDFNLGAGTSEEIAEALSREQIPFIFATGYGDSVMIPRRFKHIP